MDRGYARVSLDSERSGSISKQKASHRKFAGPDVVFYVDESVSGSKVPFAERPGGAQLLRDLRPGDRVLVTKIDRAARNVKDLLELVERIDKAGASIVFVDQNIDTSGPIGKFILVLLAAIAELEANIIGERRRESLAAFALEGRHAVGRAPFGFESVPNPDGRGLVIRPHAEDGPLLKAAIDRVLAGEPQARVVESLPMKEAGFSVLLRNPRLAGMTPTPEGGVITIDGIPRVDADAALLTMTEWAHLQDHMKTRPEKRPWSRQDGFGAILLCDTCGMRLYRSNGGPKRPNNNAYKCSRVRHQKGEPGGSVMVSAADEHIEKLFLERFGEYPVVIASWSDSMDAKTEAMALAQVRLEAAQDAFLAVVDDEEEEDALRVLREAKKALKAAGEMPAERVHRTEYAGETIAQRWERSDDGGRCEMLAAAGTWRVKPGRMSIEEKINFEPDELMLELRMRPVGEDDAAPRGFLL